MTLHSFTFLCVSPSQREATINNMSHCISTSSNNREKNTTTSNRESPNPVYSLFSLSTWSERDPMIKHTCPQWLVIPVVTPIDIDAGCLFPPKKMAYIAWEFRHVMPCLRTPEGSDPRSSRNWFFTASACLASSSLRASASLLARSHSYGYAGI